MKSIRSKSLNPSLALLLVAFATIALTTVALPAVASAETTLTIATLAPKKSAWDRVFAGMAKEIEEKTNGSVKIKIYAGGVQGDEEVVVQKMKTGQIQGAAITSIGLGKISPNVLVLQIPMLFDNWREVDYVRDQMKDQFEAEFTDKGVVLLGWGDVGFVHVFANEAIRSPADLPKVKMWAWSADPIASQFMREGGASPIPLSVPDVLPNLQTGLIDAFYNSPLATIALRWFTQVKFMSKDPIAVGLGATVVSKEAFDRLNPTEQAVVLAAGKKWHEILRKKVRKDNTKSLQLLEDNGIEVVDFLAGHAAEWRAMAKRTETKLAGKVYSQEMLDQVHRHLAAARGK